jgi:type I restriction enzyme M protein
MTAENAIGQKIWNYCNVLRDDGVSYDQYLAQLTYLIFLKMAHERTQPPFKAKDPIPKGYAWPDLIKLDGPALEAHYRKTLEELAKQAGLLGVIFRKSQNQIQDPAKLERLMEMINEETWLGLTTDVKGSIYEGLLQRNAEDIKSGAGQYFTPRNLIRAIVEVMRPEPGMSICDPACGTGGFFLAVWEYLTQGNRFKLDKEQKEWLKHHAFHGWEIADQPARMCVMNLFLHGVQSLEDESPVTVVDALMSKPSDEFDMVLTNPPFGRKSSYTIVNGNGKADKGNQTYTREDFWATTSNKQINFLQHVRSILKINGRAAIVLPDNVLFEGGAGETVRRKLLASCDVHTLMRLPTGIFYRPGVKANVLFFDKKPASKKAWTDKLWIYDLRTNVHFTLKTQQMQYEDLEDFVSCYNPANRHKRKESERFKAFTYDELVQRDKANLDIFWLKDESLEDSENLPAPEVLAEEIVQNLEAALEQFAAIQEELEN